MKLCLYIEIYAFSCVSFEKLWADKLLRLQWQTEREFFLSFFGSDSGSLVLGLVQYLYGKVKEQKYIEEL